MWLPPSVFFFACPHSFISSGTTASREPSRIFQGIPGWELTLLSMYQVSVPMLGVYTQLIEVSHLLLSRNDCLLYIEKSRSKVVQ